MIVYTDGSEFDGAPQDAPVSNVALVVQGKEVLRGKDYYYLHIGKWWGTDNPATALWHHSLGEPLLHGGFMDSEGFGLLLDKHLHR